MKKIFTLLIFSVVMMGYVSAQKTVTGNISGEDGLGLIGANILEKGTANGTITDFDGNFELTVSADDAVLIVSYAGYTTQEVDLSGQSNVSIVMAEGQLLEEVVVVGYSESTRLTDVASVSSVSAENIQNRPTPNVVSAVQGQIPGFMTTASSGQPGSVQQVRIRGTGSITAGRNPLYVVDGVIIQTGSISQLDSGSNPSDILSLLNPNDIESINVLKDASATALYGSRGSNGVVVINTKRGKSGKTAITVKTQYGKTQSMFGNFELMSPQQTWEYERQILANSGNSPEQIDATRPDTMLNNTFNWLDAAFQTGTAYNLELQAQGGNDKTRFFVSGGYNSIEGTQVFSDYRRTSLRTNIDHTASDRLKFSLNFNTSYAQQMNAVSGNRFQSPMATSFTTSPLQGAVNPATGEYYTGLEDEYFGLTNDNFLYSLPLNPVDVNTLRVLTKLDLDYQILDFLKFTQAVNVDLITDDSKDFDDPTTNDGENDNGSLDNTFNQNRSITTQSFLKYYNSFGGNHNLDAFVGFEYNRVNTKGFYARGIGFADGRLQTLNSSAEPQTVSGSISNYAFVSFLSNVNYDFLDKYLVTLSFRRDGSSRFGTNNRWGNFWSVGAAWRLSDEDFFPENDVFHDAKIKVSYGTAGNASIGNFPSQELYGFGAAYQGQPGSSPSQISNPDLTWETSDQFNVGLDFGLFNRIEGTVEYYNKVSKDLLLDVPVSAVSGFTSATRNIGELKNTGIELTLGASPVTSSSADGFTWDIDFNIAWNQNEITSLPNGEDIDNGSQIWRVGEPIRTIYIQEWAGVNPADGTPLWFTADDDENRNGVTGNYSEAGEFVVGNASPDFTAGFTNTFSYKGLYLSAFFYTAQGHELYNASLPFMDSDGTRFGWAHVTDALDHWKEPGDISARPQPRSGGNNNSASTSTRYLEDASFIRLKQATLGYSLPSTIADKLKVTNVSAYIMGENLWTSTKYSGLDPEADEDGSEFFRYPVGRTITFGLDVTF